MNENRATRSEGFLSFFQCEAMCSHLRSLVLQGIEPGPEARDVLRSLRDDFVARTTGRPSERIPAITDETTPVDLLAVAELLLATNLAFLTPEELEERASMGFHTMRDGH